MTGYRYEIGYGKHQVPVYRVYATPLRGVPPIPESSFTGRENILFAAEITVDVFGDDFLAAYTEGNNRRVVATDSMKNFILRETLAYEGSTLEGLLAFLGRRFIATYEQLHHIRLFARELPFPAVQVPDEQGGFARSDVLFARSHDDAATAMLEIVANDGDIRIIDHRCGRVGLQLLKVTGSSFTSFVRDDYTTLPERQDRPLFITLDLHWRYTDTADMLAESPVRYVPAEQVRDLAQTVFHEFVSESIQHLVHEIGTRAMDRFPQLAEISFAAENRTRDPFHESDTDPRVKVYSDPFPAFGVIRLTVRRASEATR